MTLFPTREWLFICLAWGALVWATLDAWQDI